MGANIGFSNSRTEGQKTAVVANVPPGFIAPETDLLLPTYRLKIGVTSKKAFTCQLAAHLALVKGRLSCAEKSKIANFVI